MTDDEREDWLWWCQLHPEDRERFEVYEMPRGMFAPKRWCVTEIRHRGTIASAYFDNSSDAVWHVYNILKYRSQEKNNEETT